MKNIENKQIENCGREFSEDLPGKGKVFHWADHIRGEGYSSDQVNAASIAYISPINHFNYTYFIQSIQFYNSVIYIYVCVCIHKIITQLYIYQS